MAEEQKKKGWTEEEFNRELERRLALAGPSRPPTLRERVETLESQRRSDVAICDSMGTSLSHLYTRVSNLHGRIYTLLEDIYSRL